MPIPRHTSIPNCALGGAFGAAVAGAADATLALGVGPLVPGDTVVAVLAAGLTWLLIPGVVLGLVLGVINYLSAPLRRRRPWLPWVLLGLLVLAAGMTLGWAIHVDIHFDAIDYRPMLLVTLGLMTGVVAARIHRVTVGAARLALIPVVMLGVAGPAWGAYNLGAHVGAVPLLGMHTSVVRPALEVGRRLFDGDHDGFARWFCAADCDCDDGDRAINPRAVDIPNNGVDENCAGHDLKAPVAPPPAPAPPPVARADGDVEEPKPKHLIVLITIDTVRADHLAPYGYKRVTTPNLDQLARDNVIFKQARSLGPATRYSVPAMLSGRYFSSMILKKAGKWSYIRPGNRMIAQRLKAAGYTSRGVVPQFRFGRLYGFHRGFDVFDESIYKDDNLWAATQATSHLVTNRGLRHVDQLMAQKKPWMLWLHYFDPHSRYMKHWHYPSFGRSVHDRYDGELIFTDDHIGRFLRGLHKRGLWDRVALIVAADHGEGFGTEADKGISYHGHSLYDFELKVPLYLRVPGMASRVVEQPVGLVDIAPTICELAGLDPTDGFSGVSLLGLATGRREQRKPVYFERPGTIWPNPLDPFSCTRGNCGPLFGLLDWPFKLIWDVRHNTYRLHDLSRDPGEMRNRRRSRRAAFKRMRDALHMRRYQARKPFGKRGADASPRSPTGGR